MEGEAGSQESQRCPVIVPPGQVRPVPYVSRTCPFFHATHLSSLPDPTRPDPTRTYLRRWVGHSLLWVICWIRFCMHRYLATARGKRIECMP